MEKSILAQLGIEEEIFDQCGTPGKAIDRPDWSAIFGDLARRLTDYEPDGGIRKIWDTYWREDADDDGESAVYNVASVLGDYLGICAKDIMAEYGVQ